MHDIKVTTNNVDGLAQGHHVEVEVDGVPFKGITKLSFTAEAGGSPVKVEVEFVVKDFYLNGKKLNATFKVSELGSVNSKYVSKEVYEELLENLESGIDKVFDGASMQLGQEKSTALYNNHIVNSKGETVK